MLIRGESKQFKSIKAVLVSCLIPNQIWRHRLRFPGAVIAFVISRNVQQDSPRKHSVDHHRYLKPLKIVMSTFSQLIRIQL